MEEIRANIPGSILSRPSANDTLVAEYIVALSAEVLENITDAVTRIPPKGINFLIASPKPFGPKLPIHCGTFSKPTGISLLHTTAANAIPT